MSIAFFDIEEWEEQRLPRTLADQPVVLQSDHLTAENAALAAACEVVSVFSWSQVTPPVLEKLPALKHIATRSTGTDHIDLAACQVRGITVSNVPEYGERTVAEHTFALILALSRKVLHAYDRTRRGNFSRDGLRGFDLEGKTLGLIGCGKIGSKVAQIANTFAMNVIVFDVQQDPALARQLQFRYVDSLPHLLAESDIISLHAPLTTQTRLLINMETIQHIKPGAMLINTARGDLVQTAALLAALDSGRLSGVGLDVLENERMIHEEAEILSKTTPTNQQLASLLHSHILMQHPNVLITPHNAFNSEEAVRKILETTLANIEGFLAGRPQNIIEA